MQNDFCKEKTADGEEILQYPSIEGTIANTKRLLTEARRMGVLVAYAQHTTHPHL